MRRGGARNITLTLTYDRSGMKTAGLYSGNFAQVFSELLEKTGVSCYQVSQYSHLNQAYLSRLKSGEKHNPSPEAVVRIALALAHLSPKFTVLDEEKLFKSVGRSLQIQY